MTLHTFVTHKINRFAVALATLATAGIIAFGGLTAVGAQATGTYQCGTYGGGDYNQTDCTDTPTSTGGGTGSTGTGSTGSTGATSSGSSSSTGSSSSSSSSTGSSSTGTSTTTTTPAAPSGSILLNAYSEYRSSTGKSLDLKQGAVVYFNLKGTQHSVTIKSISPTVLVVTIASTPTDVSVPVGTTVNHDTDGDGTDDIAVTYAAAASDNQSATTVFRSLGATSTDVTTQNGSTGSASTGATTDKSPNMMWIFIIPIVLGLAIIVAVIAVVMKRRKANAANGGSNFSQF